MATGPSRDHLQWPFFEPRHRDFTKRLDAFVAGGTIARIDHADVDGACRALVPALGKAGLLEASVAEAAPDSAPVDSRLVCIARESLAWHDGLADFAFAMQGLGSGAVALSGSPE